jgi:hypothetical protein
MPSSSKKQHNLMEAVAHNAAFAKKVGIPQKVGKDFAEADKGKKFVSGGMSLAKQQSINKPKTNHGASALFKRGGDMATMSSKMAKFEKSGKDKERGAKEGSAKDMAMDKMQMMGMKKGGMKKMAGGGSVDTGNKTSMTKVRTAAPSKDGVASKGKTQGKQIVMAGGKGMKRGGKTC